MSWEVFVLAAKEPPPPFDELPRDWDGESLGTARQVRELISRCLPATDWTDPTYGRFEGDGFSFSFGIRDEDPNMGFMIRVCGGGDVLTPLRALAEGTGWYLLDISKGEWLHHSEDFEAGWRGFQAYRNRVLGRDAEDESA